jgi:hypothetical protein
MEMIQHLADIPERSLTQNILLAPNDLEDNMMIMINNTGREIEQTM